MSSFFSGFGHRLKEARKLKGLNQQYLAEKLNVNRNTISNYENEVSFPDLNSLYILVNILDTSSDYLLGVLDTNEPLERGKVRGKVRGKNTPERKTNSTFFAEENEIDYHTASEKPTVHFLLEQSREEISKCRGEIQKLSTENARLKSENRDMKIKVQSYFEVIQEFLKNTNGPPNQQGRTPPTSPNPLEKTGN